MRFYFSAGIIWHEITQAEYAERLKWSRTCPGFAAGRRLARIGVQP